MYIRFDLLAQELQKTAGVQTYNVGERIVTDIRMFPLDFNPLSDKLDQDTCYVCDFRRLRSYNPHIDLAPLVCVLEPGALAQPVFFSNRTVITVSGLLMPDVMTEILRIAYSFGGRSSPLSEITHDLLHCTGIQQMLDKGTEILCNPIVLTDAEQKIIAYADPGNIAAEPYNSILQMGYLPVGHLEPERIPGGALGADDHPFICPGKGGQPAVMCKRLRVRGRIEGFLHVFEFNRPITYEDGPIVDFLGSLLALELSESPRQHSGGKKEDEIEKYLQDILNNPRDEEYMVRGQQRVGLTLKKNIYTIIIFARRSEVLPPFSYYDLAKRMAEQLPDCFGFLYRNSILLILSADEEIDDFEEYLQPIRPTMVKYSLVAGISNPFPVIQVLREHSFQALKTLQLGPVLHPDKVLYVYRDYALYYMVELCLRSEDIMAFCLPELVKLAEQSKRDNNDLLETLRVYLRCGRSKSQTAREMYVHLNTVKYRLQQIQNIMGLDFDNDDNALRLMLSFKMMEYREKFRHYEPMDINKKPRDMKEEIQRI